MYKPILCLDFDGVCHSYTSGWKGADVIPDPPVPGLFDFLERASTVFDIQIYSSRSNQPGGIEAMQKWFCEHYTIWLYQYQPEPEKRHSVEPSWIKFPTEKPAAFITLDDRAITFNGTFPDVDSLRSFQPWYRSG
jgi:hypothetical protein